MPRHKDNAGARLAAEVNSYETAERFLGNREERKLANNTYVTRFDEDHIAVILHRTPIVTYGPYGSIRLTSGGYFTTTTKARINKLLEGTPWSVAQKRHQWWVHNSHTGETIRFDDGMFIQGPSDDPSIPHQLPNPGRPSSRGRAPGKRGASRHAYGVPIKGYSVKRHSRRRPLEYARNPNGNIHDYAMMVTDGAKGQYAPADFTTNWQASIRGVSKDVLEDVMSGPDNEYYWDSWADILDNAYVDRDVDPHRWNIHQSGDIWLVRQDSPDWVWEQLTDY